MSDTKTATYKVLGTRPVRHDGVDKVTGRANYGADFHLPGMLHGKVLRSPHAHARIRSIDTSAAAALDGVFAVVTGERFSVRHPERGERERGDVPRPRALPGAAGRRGGGLHAHHRRPGARA